MIAFVQNVVVQKCMVYNIHMDGVCWKLYTHFKVCNGFSSKQCEGMVHCIKRTSVWSQPIDRMSYLSHYFFRKFLGVYFFLDSWVGDITFFTLLFLACLLLSLSKLEKPVLVLEILYWSILFMLLQCQLLVVVCQVFLYQFVMKFT